MFRFAGNKTTEVTVVSS